MLAVFAQPVGDTRFFVRIFLFNYLLGKNTLLLLHVQELVLETKEALPALALILHFVFDFFYYTKFVDSLGFGDILLVVLLVYEVAPMPISFRRLRVEVFQH